MLYAKAAHAGLYAAQQAHDHVTIHMAHMPKPEEAVPGRIAGQRHAQTDAQRPNRAVRWRRGIATSAM